MLSDQDKQRIAAEEEYRAKVRRPVKTEGFTDKLNRFRMWFLLTLVGALVAVTMVLRK